MIVGNNVGLGGERIAANRGFGITAALGAATIMVLTIAGPVTIDAGDGMFSPKTAQAAGGGQGGGNAGGEGEMGDTAYANAVDGREILPPEPLEAAITMAVFTTKISRRYPADEVATHGNPLQPISFFSELQAMSGKRITHRWLHRGRLAFEATFKIRAEHWRVWSTQLLPRDMPGEWTVEIVDEEGRVLETQKLNYAPENTALAKN